MGQTAGVNTGNSLTPTGSFAQKRGFPQLENGRPVPGKKEPFQSVSRVEFLPILQAPLTPRVKEVKHPATETTKGYCLALQSGGNREVSGGRLWQCMANRESRRSLTRPAGPDTRVGWIARKFDAPDEAKLFS
jgi:hypothetical protein